MTMTDSSDVKRSRHHRHRPWYKRLWRQLSPSRTRWVQIVLALILVVVLSILAGMYIAQSSATPGSSF